MASSPQPPSQRYSIRIPRTTLEKLAVEQPGLVFVTEWKPTGKLDHVTLDFSDKAKADALYDQLRRLTQSAFRNWLN